MFEEASRAARGTSVFLTQSFLSGLLRVFNLIVLARLLLQQEMGVIAVLGVIYGFTQFLAALGLNHASPLVVPEELAAGRPGRVRSFLYRSIILILFSSLVLIILLFFLSPFLTGTGILTTNLMELVIIIVPFSALETFLDSFLLARYTVRALAAGRVLFDTVRLGVTVGLVYAGFGVGGVLLGWLAGEVAAILVFGYAATRDLAKIQRPIEIGPILSFALPSLLFQTIDVTIQNTDRIILLDITELSTLGVYDVILSLLFMMSFVSLTMASSLYPVLTKLRLQHEGDENGASSLSIAITSLLRYILIILLPISILVGLNSVLVLDLLFGSAYAIYPGAALSFSLLVISYVLWGITYALHTVLRSLGEARFFVNVGVGVIIFEVVGCWYLTSWLGLLGSAITRCAYIFLLFITAIVQLHRRGLRIERSLVKTVLRIGLASTISSLLVFVISPSDVLYVAMWLLISIGVYIFLLFVFREVSSLDFRLARTVLPTIFHPTIDRVEQVYHGLKSDDI
ncbi:MAG: oligosaccharide flippase family protein [Candidatus Thorarchaeota archaeon]|jgi:O-antigen/teichoic acid export membrane protein